MYILPPNKTYIYNCRDEEEKEKVQILNNKASINYHFLVIYHINYNIVE